MMMIQILNLLINYLKWSWASDKHTIRFDLVSDEDQLAELVQAIALINTVTLIDRMI